jgi:transposase
MNAQKLKDISQSINNREVLEKIYTEVLYPMMLKKAESKETFLAINGHNNKSLANYGYGYEYRLWNLCRENLKLLLKEKGFKVQILDGCKDVYIYWG